MKVIPTLFWVSAVAGMLCLLNACNRRPEPKPAFIRYEIDREPYRVVNHSPDRIEVLEPMQDYYIVDKGGWRQVICGWACFGLPNDFYTIGKFVDSGSEWADDRLPGAEICPTDTKCNIFSSRRYRAPGMPGRLFVVYSNEGQPGDPSLVAGSQLSLSLSPSDPFHFTLHNVTDGPRWLCWTRADKRQEVAWGQDSRLERQTEYGTWEIISHTLDLCVNGWYGGIRIDPGQSAAVNGTAPYPGYAQLPSGVYRWVIALNYDEYGSDLIFSPRFKLGGQQ
jgi:hypothetical protein